MDLSATPGHVPGFPLTMNLRELGGWPAADGAHVRHGLVYRGGPLVGLSASERELVDGFGLRHIVDLRAEGEAQSGGEDYVPSGCDHVRIGGMVDEQGVEVDFSPRGIERIQAQIMASGDPDAFMRGLYTSMLFGNRAMHKVMELMVAGDGPLYLHCTAGKDRTGMCAAVVLMALGAGDDAVMEDYLLTNEYRRSIIEHIPSQEELAASGLDAEAWARANGVDAESLEAVFAAIDARYDSREAFLADEFGLGVAQLAALRERCLE